MLVGSCVQTLYKQKSADYFFSWSFLLETMFSCQKNGFPEIEFCLRIVMGPLSDIIGRRAGLLLCSLITLIGALLSTFAWGENVLIAARRGDQNIETEKTWSVKNSWSLKMSHHVDIKNKSFS